MFQTLFAVCPVPHDLLGGAGNCPTTDLVLLVMATFWFGYLVRGYLERRT